MASVLEALPVLVNSDLLCSGLFDMCLYLWGVLFSGSSGKGRFWSQTLSPSCYTYSLLHALRTDVQLLCVQVGDVFNNESVRNFLSLCSWPSIPSVVCKPISVVCKPIFVVCKRISVVCKPISVVCKLISVQGKGEAVGNKAPSVVQRNESNISHTSSIQGVGVVKFKSQSSLHICVSRFCYSLCLNSLFNRQSWFILVMAPRLRGTPKRGGVSGRPAPPCVTPIAMASPGSSQSEESGDSLNNSLHTARFTFKSKRNQPLISALITVIFSEEDEEKVSSEADSGKQNPSQVDRATRSGSGDVTLKVDAMIQEEEDQGDAGEKEIPPPENIIPCDPADKYATYLYPVLPPGVKLEDIGEGVMLDLLPGPPEDYDKFQGAPPKA